MHATCRQHDASDAHIDFCTTERATLAVLHREALHCVLQGRSDQIKSKVYGKMGKEIVQAVRAGGGDPTSNMRLRDLIATAKDQNVPRDIVDRNIKRASEVKTDFSEV